MSTFIMTSRRSGHFNAAANADANIRANTGVLPGVLHGFREFLRWKCIQDDVFGQPGTAGLQDAVTDLLHVRGVMRVGVDHDFHALLLSLAEMNVVKVEAVGI